MASNGKHANGAQETVESPRSKKRRLSSTVVATQEEVDDVRIAKIAPLLPPCCLLEEQPLNDTLGRNILRFRRDVHRIVTGADDRLICVVGPCSINDVKSAREYALQLRDLRRDLVADLNIVMRVYFEKPRTTVGWKGLINDPNLDGSFKINKGIRQARQLLLDINELGLPCGCEFLDTITPQFYADTVSWGAIGARTTESQVHRELASGLSMPVGFKNGTSGNVKVAVDAVMSSRQPHSFLSVTKQGLAAIVHTNGNPGAHVILRGGSDGPNYDAKSIAAASAVCKKGNVDPYIVIDCSHGNSKKIHTNQPLVAGDVAKQVSEGNTAIVGVMIESNLVEGNQKLKPGVTIPSTLKYGQSVTDACVNMETTRAMLTGLAAAVRARRKKV